MSEPMPAEGEGPHHVHMHLQCIGSFSAYSDAGESRTIEIWTHFGAVHDRDISRVAPSLLVLTTADGHGVDRISQGEYCLTDTNTRLTSSDPAAP